MRNIAFICTLTISALFLSACESEEERAESHYKRGLELVEDGELLKARLELRNALASNQKLVPALYTLGQVEQRLQNVQGAARIFLRIAEAVPEHLEARLHLANILLAARQIEQALKYTDEAYKLAPDDNRVLVLKGAVALRLEKTDEAVQAADAVLETDPENLDALMLRAAERIRANDAEGALTFLNRGEEKNASNVILQLLRLRVLNTLKDTAGVEGVLKKLIGYYPENVSLRYGLAQWYQGADRKLEAEEVLRQITLDFPKDTQAGRTFVAYLSREKGFEAARAELLKRIEQAGDGTVYRQILAEMNFSAGNDEDAYKLLESVISQKGTEPDGTRAKVLLARMKADRNQLDEADNLLNEILVDDAKNAEALAVRSVIRISKKQYAQAIEDLLKALNEEPESIWALQLLARAYELNGSSELAEEQLAKAVRLDGFKPGVGLGYVQFLLRYGKTEQAERVLTEVRLVAPSNRQVLTLLSRIKLSRRDWLGAQEVAETLHKLDDTTDVADRILAEILSGQQKFEESNELLKTALSDAASDAAPLARYVDNLVRAGKKGQAIDFLTDILSTDPKNLRARVLLGAVHEVDGKLDLARAALKEAAKQDTDGVGGQEALARFLVRRGSFEEAEQVIRTALTRQEDNLAIRLLLANVLERTGQFEAAIVEYKVMFEASPQSTVIANNLASLLADHGSTPEDLEQAYSIAVRFSGSDIPHFLDTLGWIHYRKKDYEQAATLLRPAAEQLQNMGIVQYHLGMTYKALGQNAPAIEQLEKAIKLAEREQFAQLEEAQAALRELKAASVSHE